MRKYGRPGQARRANCSPDRLKRLQKEYWQEYHRCLRKSQNVYLDSINSSKNIAKLQKLLKGGGIATCIPLFQNNDGST